MASVFALWVAICSLFFFSSRRRHTRFDCDWSSDVCSSDLAAMLFYASVAQAGPPLICHAIEIGQAKSLPWISDSWNLSGGENYDTKNLVKIGRASCRERV